MKQIAIFASGNGSNAENLAVYFENSDLARVSLIVCNKPNAGVLERAKRLGIATAVFTKSEIAEGTQLMQLLKDRKIDLIVLAGFLLKIPDYLIGSYPQLIVNIHPALLPKFGGKGMYGNHVHEAVLKAGEVRSGITIHFVNENYDEGGIIFQAGCDVKNGDDAASLAARIHELEYKYFPEVVESIIKNG